MSRPILDRHSGRGRARRRLALALAPIVIALAACAPTFRLDPLEPDPSWYPPPDPSASGTMPLDGSDDALLAPIDPAQPLELSAAIERAVANNPDVRAARERWLAAANRPGQVTLPNPMVQYTFFPSAIETRVGPQNHRVSLMQRIPWPGRLVAEANARGEDANAAQLTFEIEARNVIADVIVTYHELVYLDLAKQVVAENIEIAERLATIADAWQAREEPPSDSAPRELVPGRRSVALVDVLKARAAVAQLSYDQITIAENRAVQEARLCQLLGLAVGTPLGAPEPLADVALDLDLHALLTLALTHRQELERIAARARAAGHRLEAAKLRAVPDFTIGATWINIGSPAGVDEFRNDAVAVMFGITLPLWAGANQSAVDEAAHKLEAERASGQSTALAIAAQLTDVYTRYTRAERLVELYRDTLLPEASGALIQIEALQREGHGTLGDLLEAHSLWLNFSLALERARTNRFQALARLERATGMPLADHVQAVAAADDGDD